MEFREKIRRWRTKEDSRAEYTYARFRGETRERDPLLRENGWTNDDIVRGGKKKTPTTARRFVVVSILARECIRINCAYRVHSRPKRPRFGRFFCGDEIAADSRSVDSIASRRASRRKFIVAIYQTVPKICLLSFLYCNPSVLHFSIHKSQKMSYFITFYTCK